MTAATARPAQGAMHGDSMWSANGRTGRGSYLWTTLLVGTCAGLLQVLVVAWTESPAGTAILLALGLPLAWTGFVATIRRCHDLGKSAWYCLFGLVPVVNLAFGLYLLFARGQPHANEYGPSPTADPEHATRHDERFADGINSANLSSEAAPVLLPSEDESYWAAALAEFDGAQRRLGLWARSYSEANGEESRAKAAYLKVRVRELRLDAIERQKQQTRAEQETEVRRLQSISEKERLAVLSARHPKGICPCCRRLTPHNAQHCPLCGAFFVGESAWQLMPTEHIPAAEASADLLLAAGYTVTPIKSGWIINDGDTVAAYAFSQADFGGLAQLADAGKGLELWYPN